MIDPVTAVQPSPGRHRPPPGSCDTHTHVLGPFDRFPLVSPPDYAMPLAPAPSHLAMLDRLGMARGIVVQTSQQGTDMRALLDALGQSAERLRGVGAASVDVDDRTLDAFQRAGVRGLRFVEAPAPGGGSRLGAIGFAALGSLASRIVARGWQAHIWAKLPAIVAALDTLLATGAPLVIEHMAMLAPTRGTAEPDFQRLLAAFRDGQLWIKLSLCRCSTAPGYADLRPFHDLLVESRPDRLLWGSDWPYIRMAGGEPDAGALLDLFLDWIGDRSIADQILVKNPARLFGFEEAAMAA